MFFCPLGLKIKNTSPAMMKRSGNDDVDERFKRFLPTVEMTEVRLPRRPEAGLLAMTMESPMAMRNFMNPVMQDDGAKHKRNNRTMITII
jgi:hypothetical protein